MKKKKLLCTVFMAALAFATTNTFVSCKDYDDDISDLRNEIDGLVTADQLSTRVTELQNAIRDAKDAAEQKAAAAQQVADAAKTAASNAASAADAANRAIEAANKKIADLEANGATKDELETAKDAAAAAAAAVADLTESTNNSISEVSSKIDTAISGVQADIKANSDALAALETRLEAVEDKLAAGGNGESVDLGALRTEVSAIQTELESLGIAVSTMITDIQIYDTHTLAAKTGEVFDNTLNFIQAQELRSGEIGLEAWNNTISGATVDNKITFNGETYIGEDSLLVRVSPADAVLKAENISLINSQGVEISKEVVEVVGEPVRYNRLMTRAAGSNTGLWVVKFKANDVADAFYEKAVDKSQGYERRIVYAVAVKNNVVDNKDRRVTSEFALDLNTEVAEHGWDFAVNDVDINKIRNRYVNCTGETNVITNNEISYPATYREELVWLDEHRPAVNVILDGASKNAADRYNNIDNRNNKKILGVEVGKPIKIKFDVTGHGLNYAKVKGFYVTLDERFALESDPSEINAWTSYEYQGVGYKKADGSFVPATLFEGSEGEIVIKNLQNVTGDVIGFRVYAVNYDGTLSDPDGRAFYVAVGQVKTDVVIPTANAYYQELNGTLAFNTGADDDLIATDAFDVPYDVIKTSAVDYALPAGKYALSSDGWLCTTADKAGDYKNFRVLFYDANGQYIGDNAADNSKVYYNNNTGKSSVSYVRYVIDNPGKYIDGDTYTQTITLQKYADPVNLTGLYDVRTITVSVKKVMPTEGPTFAFITGQHENNVGYQWLTPTDNSNVAQSDYTIDPSNFRNGTINLENVFINNDNRYTYGMSDLKNNDGFVFEVGKANDNDDWGTYVLAANPTKWTRGIAKAIAAGSGYPLTYKLDVRNWPADGKTETDAVAIDSKTKRTVSAQFKFRGISKRIATTTPTNDFVEDLDWIVNSPTELPVVYCSWTREFSAWYNNTARIFEFNWSNTTQDILLSNVAWDSKRDRIPAGVTKPTGTFADLMNGNLLEIIRDNDKLPVDLEDIPAGISTGVWTTDENGQVNPYYQAYFDYVSTSSTGFDKIVLNRTNQSIQVPSTHPEFVHFYVRDCFGNVKKVTLNIRIKNA